MKAEQEEEKKPDVAMKGDKGDAAQPSFQNGAKGNEVEEESVRRGGQEGSLVVEFDNPRSKGGGEAGESMPHGGEEGKEGEGGMRRKPLIPSDRSVISRLPLPVVRLSNLPGNMTRESLYLLLVGIVKWGRYHRVKFMKKERPGGGGGGRGQEKEVVDEEAEAVLAKVLESPAPDLTEEDLRVLESWGKEVEHEVSRDIQRNQLCLSREEDRLEAFVFFTTRREAIEVCETSGYSDFPWICPFFLSSLSLLFPLPLPFSLSSPSFHDKEHVASRSLLCRCGEGS